MLSISNNDTLVRYTAGYLICLFFSKNAIRILVCLSYVVTRKKDIVLSLFPAHTQQWRLVGCSIMPMYSVSHIVSHCHFPKNNIIFGIYNRTVTYDIIFDKKQVSK